MLWSTLTYKSYQSPRFTIPKKNNKYLQTLFVRDLLVGRGQRHILQFGGSLLVLPDEGHYEDVLLQKDDIGRTDARLSHPVT